MSEQKDKAYLFSELFETYCSAVFDRTATRLMIAMAYRGPLSLQIRLSVKGECRSDLARTARRVDERSSYSGVGTKRQMEIHLDDVANWNIMYEGDS